MSQSTRWFVVFAQQGRLAFLVSLELDKVLSAMDISQEFKNETDKLLRLLATHTEETLNMVPLQGGWSAAQVGDHLYRSYQIEDLLGKKSGGP